MKLFLAIFFVVLTFYGKGQSESKILHLRLDTCKYVKTQIGASTINGNPIYIANGVIVNPNELNPDSVIDVSVVICPESFTMFKYIGSQGAIVINTRQVFDITNLSEIKKNKNLTGDVTFALNSLLLLDSTLNFSLKVIDEIEITNVVDPTNKSALKPCINIWTIPKKDREKYFIHTL